VTQVEPRQPAGVPGGAHPGDLQHDMVRAEPGVFVVIAAYNEESVIDETILELTRRFEHVVVVDDGSRDRTAERARQSGAEVLRHPINLGQGAALQTGITYALRGGATHVATFDADGQHDPQDLIHMLDVLGRTPGTDIVLGSRFLGTASGLPLHRKIVLKGARFFTNLTTGVRLTDAHNGLRLMTAEAAAKIRITQNGMAHASEFIARIRQHRLKYVEVPVHIRYTAYSLRKGQRLSSALNIVTDLLASRFMKW